jgi:hypothetical protein
MLREPHIYVGLAVGAVVAWLLTRGRGQLVPITPHFTRPIRRTPRRGASWPGQPRG